MGRLFWSEVLKINVCVYSIMHCLLIFNICYLKLKFVFSPVSLLDTYLILELDIY